MLRIGIIGAAIVLTCGLTRADPITYQLEAIAGQFNGPFRLRGRTGDVKGIHIRATFTEQGTPSILLWDLDGTIRFPN